MSKLSPRPQPDVRVGQVWIDCDPRMTRRIVIDRIEGAYAFCHNWASPRLKTRIRLDRFRPTSTGFRLVGASKHGTT